MFRGTKKKFTKRSSSASISARLNKSQQSEKFSGEGRKKDGSKMNKTVRSISERSITKSEHESTLKSMLDEHATSKEKTQIYRFVKRTMEKGVRGLRSEFLSMKRSNNLKLMTKFVEMNQRGKNRYKDVGCLDESRVKLQNCGADDYIHANYVSTPSSSKRFICTQAPLEKTCRDFWLMCIQERAEFIVMLCNLFEKGAKKCCEYYPTSGSLQFDEIKVEYVESTMVKFTISTPAQIKITTLLVERNGRKLKTKHIHWIDWPDRGVPPPDTAIIQLLEVIRNTQYPIVVHCSAGVGRTGSLVLIQYILESISLEKPIEECDKILLKIRGQRANTIQTDQQYLFVHQVLLNYFSEKELLDPLWKAHLDRFSTDYKKFVF